MKPKDSSAPGNLETVRRFVNSVDLENPQEREQLASAAAASAWLHEQHLLPDYDKLDEEEWEVVLALREAFRMELLSHTGEGDGDAAWENLSVFADRAELGVRLREPGEVDLIAEGRGIQLVAGRLFAIVYDAIRTGQWARLKACRKESCLFGFYDRSKNGSGAWCDMAVCGNRVKAQRRRRRQSVVTSL